jgi:hypothetical protein
LPSIFIISENTFIVKQNLKEKAPQNQSVSEGYGSPLEALLFSESTNKERCL